MICAKCSDSFKTWRAFKAHRPCFPAARATWEAHLDAKDRGKRRKAGRLARKAMGIVRESKPIPEALRARWADPNVKQAAAQASKIRRAAIRQTKQALAAAGRKRRRILL